MKVTCTNPKVEINVYHDGLHDHYFVAVFADGKRVEVLWRGYRWEDAYYGFVFNTIDQHRG